MAGRVGWLGATTGVEQRAIAELRRAAQHAARGRNFAGEIHDLVVCGVEVSDTDHLPCLSIRCGA